jgi:hypothetical protein
MIKNKLLMIALGGVVLGLVVSLLINAALSRVSANSCTPVHVVAIGGCDGDGTCGVVAVTQDKEIVKGKASYPIAGLLDCRESIDE